MPKETFTLNDFSGGSNGYVDPLHIADNELAQCKGFKAEPGVVSVIGDMKATYTPAAAAGNTRIQAGYGLFAFSSDYDPNGDINNTDYLALLDHVTVEIYSNSDDDSNDDAWVNTMNMGTSASDADFNGEVYPCFFIADGAVRVSPGNFVPKDSGGQINGAIGVATVHGNYIDITTDATISNHVTAGDTVIIGGQEMIVLVNENSTSMHVVRNMTGTFSSAIIDNSTIYSIPDTRWRGMVKRRNFEGLTSIGTFSEWYTTFAHPRPPVMHNAIIDHDTLTDFSLVPFSVEWFKEDETVSNDGNQSPRLNIGFFEDTDNVDSNWAGEGDNAVLKLYVTALYDDVKQESQPHAYVDHSDGSIETLTVPAGKELAIWIGMEYANSATTPNTYCINKRVTGARLYYEDTTGDPGILYQLLEIDFQYGCKKSDAEIFTPWDNSVTDVSVSCPLDAGKAYGSRAGSNAFIFADPPKSFTYEINTMYPPHVNTHARYKTAVVANRRLFAGNVYQSGKANGDRMLQSPADKFDILPEYGDFVIDVTKGDGDSIVKLEAYADRVLQFKKRALYIINVSNTELGEEYIESSHKGMGVQNPSQTCMTSYGVAWVNPNGVFLYDGQEVVDLTIDKLQMTNTTDRPRALNIDEDKVPIIGYHISHKWLVIIPQSTTTGSDENEAWIHDFKNGSWTYAREFTNNGDFKTNIVWTSDNSFVFAAGTNSSNTPDIFKYRSPSVDTSANGLLLLTKEFHLDAPGIKKKLRSVYITYSASANTKIEADLIYKSISGEATDDLTEANGGSTYYTEADGFLSTTDNVRTVELVPTTYSTNAYTFQLKLHNPDAAYPHGADFKLYNISFVYRQLGVR